jgi:cysteine desulfurase / selenocysteine lyase
MTPSHDFRADFPVFVHHPNLVYLDSTSTTQKPQRVIDRLSTYLSSEYANIHRGAYALSERSEELYSASKEAVKKLICAKSSSEIIYTANATAAVNLLTLSLVRSGWLRRGDRIILSLLEHHANIVPWQIAAESLNLEIVFVPITSEYTLDMNAYAALIAPNTRVISITGASNVTGSIPNWSEISRIARDHERKRPEGNPLYLVMDASQVVPHSQLDVEGLDLDFVFFTGHKIWADSGIGVLYGRRAHLKAMSPGTSGGGAINRVTEEGFEPAGLPFKFEAGTPNMSGAVSLLAAVEYLESIGGYAALTEHESELNAYILEQIRTLPPGIRLIGSMELWVSRAPVYSFVVEWVHSNDIADALALGDICVRAGHHCTEPLHLSLGLNSTLRMSTGIYTTRADIDSFFRELLQFLRK